MVEEYKFGSITIDGKTYDYDVEVRWSPKETLRDPTGQAGEVLKWWRKESHVIDLEDIQRAIDQNPDTIVIGTGESGAAKVTDRLKQELKVKRPIATLQFILNKLNQDEVPAIKKFAEEHKIDKLYIKPFILSEYAYTKDEVNYLASRFLADKDIDDDSIVYKKDQEGIKPKAEYDTCKDVKRVFTILADGRAVMCCFDLLGDYVYGDLSKDDFKTVWNSTKATAIREAAYQRKTPLCKVCGNVE